MLNGLTDTESVADSGEASRSSDPASAKARLTTRSLQNAILRSETFSIIATDAEGVIQLFNAGSERLLGYQTADVVNRIRPSDLHDPAEVLARAMALSVEFNTTISPGFEALAFKASRGIEDIYELTYICQDGTRFPAVVSITALRADDNAIIGYLLIGSHNAVRRRVELELNTAITVADQSNLAKSNFLSNMSHELRTPLNAILGFAQLLENGVPPPTIPQKRSVDQILKAGWYLLDLINEILDLALIESGKLSLSIESISLGEVLRESQAMIEPLAEKRGIQVSFPKVGATVLVQADRTRLKQVFINLLSNAIKYNRTGGAVTLECVASGPRQIRVSVADTGEGLSPGQLGQLFQPFNRLGSEARATEGAGIGLVICKRLVELMGGLIGARSTVGIGSVFWVDLHAATELQWVGVAGDSVPVSSARVVADVRTVLYVEDNAANLLLVEDLIARRPDVRLLCATDATAGVAIAKKVRPDVVLMDINLPGISGIDALIELAADPGTAAIPVIALSAYAGSRDIEECLNAGFFSYITKPIKIAEFMNTLTEALQAAASGLVKTKARERPT